MYSNVIRGKNVLYTFCGTGKIYFLPMVFKIENVNGNNLNS